MNIWGRDGPELGHLRGVHAARLPAPAPLLPPALIRRLEIDRPTRLDHRRLQPLVSGCRGPRQVQPPRPPLGSPDPQVQQRRIIQGTRIPALRIRCHHGLSARPGRSPRVRPLNVGSNVPECWIERSFGRDGLIPATALFSMVYSDQYPKDRAVNLLLISDAL